MSSASENESSPPKKKVKRKRARKLSDSEEDFEVDGGSKGKAGQKFERMNSFIRFDEDTLKEELGKADNKHTVKQEEKSQRAMERCMDSYEEYKELKGKWWELSKPKLDELMAKFYLGAQTDKQERYKMNSMNAFRYSFARILNGNGVDWDLRDPRQFPTSAKAWKRMSDILKQEGKGVVKSYPEINDSDLQRIRESDYMNPDKGAGNLQRLVQFYIRVFMARRGMENIENLKKSDFEVRQDPKSKMFYVAKVTKRQAVALTVYMCDAMLDEIT